MLQRQRHKSTGRSSVACGSGRRRRRAVQFCAIKSRLCLCSWLWLVISLGENHGAYFLSFLSLFFASLRRPSFSTLRRLKHPKWTVSWGSIYENLEIWAPACNDFGRRHRRRCARSALRKWNCWLLLSPPLEIATKLALKLECASSSRGVLLAGGFCPAPRSTLTPAAAAAIVLKPSSSHENYVFMCDAEKSIPKSENLIIL